MSSNSPPDFAAEIQSVTDLGYKAGYVVALADLSDLVAADQATGIEPSLPRLLGHLRTLYATAPCAVPR